MSLTIRIAVLVAVVGALVAVALGPAAAQQSVDVSLNDAPFEVVVSPSSASAGSIDFQVSNDGAGLPHNLRVIATDLAPDALPVVSGQVDESAVTVVGSSGDLAQGGTETVNANLSEGNYVLICNISGHYSSGMYTAFTVTAAPSQQPTDTPLAPGDPTPTTEVTGLAETGVGPGPQDGSSSGSWWMLAALAAAGAALLGVGTVTYARARSGR